MTKHRDRKNINRACAEVFSVPYTEAARLAGPRIHPPRFPLRAGRLPLSVAGSNVHTHAEPADWPRLRRDAEQSGLSFCEASPDEFSEVKAVEPFHFNSRDTLLIARERSPRMREHEKTRLHLHEVWTFEHIDGRHVQRLVRLVRLCQRCHGTQHMCEGDASGRRRDAERAAAASRWEAKGMHDIAATTRSFIGKPTIPGPRKMWWLQRVNGWTDEQTMDHVQQMLRVAEELDEYEWDLDMSLLGGQITVPATPTSTSQPPSEPDTPVLPPARGRACVWQGPAGTGRPGTVAVRPGWMWLGVG